MEQHSVAKQESSEKVVPVLLRSAEMHWRGQLRDNSIRKLSNRFVQGHGTPHIRLNDSPSKIARPASHIFSSISSVVFF